MSDHEEMELLVSAYLDHEATPEECRVVEQHLEECAACRATLASFSAMHALYRELEVKTAPPDFRQQMTQRLDERPRWGGLWRRPRLVYAGSLAMLLIFAVVMTTVSPSWFDAAPEPASVAQAVDVYAEDILFGDTTSILDDVFTWEETDEGVKSEASQDDFLDALEFFDDSAALVL